MLTIVGTGAMATLFAARMGRITPLTVLGSWAEAVSLINRQGVHVQGEAGPPVRVTATTDPADCAGSRLALVLVKAWQTGRAAAQIDSFLPPDGIALTLQNGLGNYETLSGALGEARVALGTTLQGATLLGPGHVRDTGRGPVHIAEHPGLDPLARLLKAAGFDVLQHPASALLPLIWGKLAVNAAINPLTALLRVPNGELLGRPDALALMDAAARETAAVARAQGILLPFADPAAQARQVARATSANRSSMFQDILRGAPTEIDAINGAVARAAVAAGENAPVNETLWRLVKAIVNSDQQT
jgi:2-dehydropantoate 2-reductase